MKKIALIGIMMCFSCGGGGGGGGGGAESSHLSSSSSGNGGANTTSSKDCVPKITCESIGAECGTILDDGCGNPIDCGVCDSSNYQTTCGEDGWDMSGTYHSGSDNVCGGGCEAFTLANVNFDCAAHYPQYPHEWHCAQPKSNKAPPTGSACVMIPNYTDNQWWCCEQGK